MITYEIYNPNNIAIEQLPIIYGFNGGGKTGWYWGELIAEDGTYMGNHLCSHESYMYQDLGIEKGSSPDRHENFRLHYPNGYRMEFVSMSDVKAHSGLIEAFKKNQELA